MRFAFSTREAILAYSVGGCSCSDQMPKRRQTVLVPARHGNYFREGYRAMTLRQVLEVIRQRWLLLLLTTMIVLGAAGAYVYLSPKVYASTAVVRYSLAASTLFDGGDGYGGIDLDVDPDFVKSQVVLAPAAAAIGDSAASLQAALTVELVEGVRTNRLAITATGSDPELSMDRANAVSDAYITHLQGQVDEALAAIEAELKLALDERSDAVSAAAKRPNDPVAQQQLSLALSRVLGLQNEVEGFQDSGPPAVLLQRALPGALQGPAAATILAIGLISGLLAGAGLALIREQFDDRLRNALSIEEAIEQPALGEISLIRHHDRKASALPAASPIATPFSESIRALRTSLLVLFPRPHSVIAVTSPQPGDGKTFVVANLAVSMARSGKNVILIGGDLRRPRLDQYFPASRNVAGFAEVILNDKDPAAIEELLVSTQFDGLRVLPPGLSRSEPADLLAGDTLPRVIKRVASLADVVLIDTPPGLALTDPAIIGSLSSGVVVIASVNSTFRKHLIDTLRGLEINGASVAGVVVNRSRGSLPKTYGSYYLQDDTANEGLSAALTAGRSLDNDRPPDATVVDDRDDLEEADTTDRVYDQLMEPDYQLDDDNASDEGTVSIAPADESPDERAPSTTDVDPRPAGRPSSIRGSSGSRSG